MDIYCPRCAEPCDTYELHEFDMTYDAARRVFFDPARGCGQLFNDRPCQPSDDPWAAVSSVLADLLGDDVDGIAAMLEDADMLGMFR